LQRERNDSIRQNAAFEKNLKKPGWGKIDPPTGLKINGLLSRGCQTTSHLVNDAFASKRTISNGVFTLLGDRQRRRDTPELTSSRRFESTRFPVFSLGFEACQGPSWRRRNRAPHRTAHLWRRSFFLGGDIRSSQPGAPVAVPSSRSPITRATRIVAEMCNQIHGFRTPSTHVRPRRLVGSRATPVGHALVTFDNSPNRSAPSVFGVVSNAAEGVPLLALRQLGATGVGSIDAIA